MNNITVTIPTCIRSVTITGDEESLRDLIIDFDHIADDYYCMGYDRLYKISRDKVKAIRKAIDRYYLEGDNGAGKDK